MWLISWNEKSSISFARRTKKNITKKRKDTFDAPIKSNEVN